MASNTDKFMEVGDPGTATTLSAPGYTAGAASINVGSTSNWPTATGVVFAMDEVETVDGEEVRVDGTYNEFVGTVSTGTQITNVDWARGVGDRNYSAGATTRVYIVVSAERENRLAQGMVVEHNQDGTHSDITATTVTATGIVTASSFVTTGSGSTTGYEPLSGTVTAVTYNGNRSYDLTTSADNSALISPGMRLRTTRTVAAPTRSTSLNGTNQYWNDTSVSGMTFTDDFCAGAWVKLSSYPTSDINIISRYNGTSGWQLRVESSGIIRLLGYNGGVANASWVNTYQSLPLNKWVHVSGQLDMSAFTASSTTSYIMLDGVDVPVAVGRGGTNPVALVQAGNLEVGSANATGFFPGKIAQAFVSSAKITQANVRTLISQGLTASLISTHSIVSAYSFDGNANDLNTTNANNLTAQGSATATNADSPFGGQAGGTISSTLDYGIVQKVTASTITVQVAEGCTIPTSGGVSAVSYSTYKSPYGFPGQVGKWVLETQVRAQNSQLAPGGGTWYNVGSINLTVPVGEWEIGYKMQTYVNRVSGDGVIKGTISTANNSDTFSGNYLVQSGTNPTTDLNAPLILPPQPLSVSTAAPYYFNIGAVGAGYAGIYISSSASVPGIVSAKNALL